MSEIESATLSQAKRALLEERLRGAAPIQVPGSPVPRFSWDRGLLPLSAAQEQLWYFSQLAPESPLYNEAVSIRKEGDVDLVALRRAFNAIVERHQMWRSTFTVVRDKTYQLVHPSVHYDLPLIDLSMMSRAEAERRGTKLAVEEAVRPYDFERGPLLRPILVRLASDHHRLYLAMHHLIFDGVSLYRVVLPELVSLYDAFAAGRPDPLSSPLAQYADFARWEKSAANDADQGVPYWRDRLDDLPEVQLPLDHTRPTRPRFQGRIEPITVSAVTVERIEVAARAAGCTLFQALAAAFSLLLNRFTGLEDVVFGTVTDLRDRRQFESVVGYCLTPLVIRNDLTGDPTFDDLLRRTRDSVLEALEHKIPFQRLVSDLRPARLAGANPIFQSMIVLEPPTVTSDSSWSIHQMEVEIGNALGKAKFDIHIELDRRPEGHISGRLIYDSDLFDASTARRMGECWSALLGALGSDSSRRISAIPVLTEEERARQLVGWNATGAPVPNLSVPELIRSHAKTQPQRTAVSCREERITYGQLNARAQKLAEALLDAGVKPGGVVGLLAERSIEMVVAMLGIMKAGAAYLPLDPRHPTDRIAYMLEDSGAVAVVAQGALCELMWPGRLPTFRLEELERRREPGSTRSDASSPVSQESAAYVLYTSGSTGRPKGVRISHGNVANLVVALSRAPGLRKDDRLLAVASYAFDMSVADFWATLGVGALLMLAPQEAVGDARELRSVIESHRPSVMQATPTTWQMLIDSGWGGSPGLKLLVGGEALSPKLAGDLLGRASEVWNMYGPTETTVWSSCAQLFSAAPITVGTPLANTRIYILDASRQPVLPGVAGELYIGGAGVALGYVNEPALTDTRFVPSEFVPGDRLYRTGDRGRFLRDGRIELLGRADCQIKIRGFRVEPGEIESHLLAHPSITAAAVIAWTGESEPAVLAAYLVCDAHEPSVSELRSFLQTRLPSYMVPSHWSTLDRLPLTASGKLDRRALPPPRSEVRAGRPAPTKPRSEVEERLLAVWARHLDGCEFGVDDDFFECGGHSLLAVRLMVDVERELGVRVRLDTMFERGATVAGMAAVIEGAAAKAPLDVIGASEDGRAALPYLFFVQPDESTMLTLRHFTRSLAPGHRVVGLLPERVNGRFKRSTTIEQLAGPLVASIRRQQPAGPYYVAGFSLGGLLAYEVAGRLEASGEQVAWLGILDCAGDPAIFQRLLWQHSVPGRVASLFNRAARREFLTQGSDLLTRALRSPGVRLGLFPEPPKDDFDWRGAMALGSGYRCRPHSIPVELFVSANSVEMMGSSTLGWDKVHRGTITSHSIPGDHLAMVTEPHVRLVVELLGRSLRGSRVSGIARSA